MKDAEARMTQPWVRTRLTSASLLLAMALVASSCETRRGLSGGDTYVALGRTEDNDAVLLDLSGRRTAVDVACPPRESCGIGLAKWAPDGSKFLLPLLDCVFQLDTLSCEDFPLEDDFYSWSMDSEHALFLDPDTNMLYRARLDGSERENLAVVQKLEIVSPDETLALHWPCPDGVGDCDDSERTPELLDLRTGDRRPYPCISVTDRVPPYGIVRTWYWLQDNRTTLVMDTYQHDHPLGYIWLCDTQTGTTQTLVAEDVPRELRPVPGYGIGSVSPDERWASYKAATGEYGGASNDVVLVDLTDQREPRTVHLDGLDVVSAGFTYDGAYLIAHGDRGWFAISTATGEKDRLDFLSDLDWLTMSPVALTLPRQ